IYDVSYLNPNFTLTYHSELLYSTGSIKKKDKFMNIIEAITKRRSIRKFKGTPISDDIIIKILNAAVQAPSGKNRQPWHFIVVKDEKKNEMMNILRQVINNAKQQGRDTGSSEGTAQTMEQAPVTIFIFNANAERAKGKKTSNIVDAQSIGAAIQNMLLASLEYDIGSLWICDVFYADDELCTWLGQTQEMIAAVSLGYPDEQPNARPRKQIEEVAEWF
ncbi:MAG: nitroreductase family protein, partial [bacterium]